MPQQERGTQPKPGPYSGPPQLHRPGVLQGKAIATTQVRPAATAPSIYRPEPKPIVQPKMAATTQLRKPPVALPVYRPHAAPKVLQTKRAMTHPPINQSEHPPVAHPIYCPQPMTKIARLELAGHQSPKSGRPPCQSVSPLVYRTQQKPIAQPKMTITQQAHRLPKPIDRPELKSLQPEHRSSHCDAGCGCRGERVCRPPSSNWMGTRTRGAVILAMLTGGKRINPPRTASFRSKHKRLTPRQADIMFGSGTSSQTTSKKRKLDECRDLRSPSAWNWRRTLWDGDSRPAWNAAAAAILPANCVLCAANGIVTPATDRDHIIPYRRYISDNAPNEVFCDDTCHYLGVSMVNASFWSNNLNNLQPLCSAHNGAKAAADRADPNNVAAPPTLIGPCPNPGNCPACNANHCL